MQCAVSQLFVWACVAVEFRSVGQVMGCMCKHLDIMDHGRPPHLLPISSHFFHFLFVIPSKRRAVALEVISFSIRTTWSLGCMYFFFTPTLPSLSFLCSSRHSRGGGKPHATAYPINLTVFVLLKQCIASCCQALSRFPRPWIPGLRYAPPG